MNDNSSLTDLLKQHQLDPNTKLGQHFLVDSITIQTLSAGAKPNDTVLEVGAGPGQLTSELAKRAKKVFSFEIDQRYRALLAEVAQRHSNINFIFENVLESDLIGTLGNISGDNLVVAANLPFHIAEPFLHQLVDLPFREARLLLGSALVKEVNTTNPSESTFGQLSLLCQTFFETTLLLEVSPEAFVPPPPTSCSILKLAPLKCSDFSDLSRFLKAALFFTAPSGSKIKNVLKEALIRYSAIDNWNSDFKYVSHLYRTPVLRDGRQVMTQRQAREQVAKQEIQESILDKSFQQLNNAELGVLVAKLAQMKAGSVHMPSLP